MRFFVCFFLSLLLPITACEEPGSYSAVPEGTRRELRDTAGMIARFSVLHPEDGLRPPKPDEAEIERIMELCSPHPEAWAYFYACIADTISKIDPPEPACQEMDFGTYSQAMEDSTVTE